MSDFPKGLCKGDEYKIVQDAEAEKAARSDGFAMLGEEKKPAKRAAKKKAAE